MRPFGLAALALSLVACGGTKLTPDAAVIDPSVDAWTQCPPTPPPVCDYFLSCGCDPDEKCSAIGSGPVCVHAGTLWDGEECAQDTDCGYGLFCGEYGGARRCLYFCDEQHACPTVPAQDCFILLRSDDEEEPAVIGHLCGNLGSLLDQDCPYAGQGAYPSSTVTTPEQGVCIEAGMYGQGDPCAVSNQCVAGMTCVDPAGPDTPMCTALCDRLDGDPGCEVGWACKLLPGHAQTGVCLP